MFDSDAEEDTLSELEISFNKASKIVASKLASQLGNTDLLYLYARYKQGIEGPCNVERPNGWFDAKGKQKWDAWKAIGDLSKEKAMEEYISMVEKLDPEFKESKNSMSSSSGGQFGMAVSTLRTTESALPEAEKNIFDWAKEGNIQEVEKKLSGVSTLPVDADGLTPLHWACDRGCLDLVKVLLERFPHDVNAIDSSGLTPLHYACCCQYPDVIRILLDHKADPSIKDLDGLDCKSDLDELLKCSEK